jgi:hypothetical protein
LHDLAFFRFLSRIDAELAAETRQARCLDCKGPLHVADFPRKPRGCPAAVREEYSRRLSFTCGWCDARSTPASVRFLGRRVYVAVMLMLVSPPTSSVSRTVGNLLEVPARTVGRWRTWWERDFQRTRFWQSVRERFVPSLPGGELPHGLLARFQAERSVDRIAQMLRFISPLSTASVSK